MHSAWILGDCTRREVHDVEKWNNGEETKKRSGQRAKTERRDVTRWENLIAVQFLRVRWVNAALVQVLYSRELFICEESLMPQFPRDWKKWTNCYVSGPFKLNERTRNVLSIIFRQRIFPRNKIINSRMKWTKTCIRWFFAQKEKFCHKIYTFSKKTWPDSMRRNMFWHERKFIGIYKSDKFSAAHFATIISALSITSCWQNGAFLLILCRATRQREPIPSDYV